MKKAKITQRLLETNYNFYTYKFELAGVRSLDNQSILVNILTINYKQMN